MTLQHIKTIAGISSGLSAVALVGTLEINAYNLPWLAFLVWGALTLAALGFAVSEDKQHHVITVPVPRGGTYPATNQYYK